MNLLHWIMVRDKQDYVCKMLRADPGTQWKSVNISGL